MNGIKRKKVNTYYKWIWIEILLLLLAIYVPYRLGMQRLNEIEVIHIALDWMAMFIMIVILNSCIHVRKTTFSRSFLKLIIMIYFVLFLEVGSWTVDKITEYRMINYLCNVGCNTAFLIATFLYTSFVYDSLGISEQKDSLLYRSIFSVIVLGIAAEILNLPFGYFYRIDEAGRYTRTTVFGEVLAFLPFFYALAAACVVVLKQKIVITKKLTYLSYALIPFVISIWYTITGFPPTVYLSAFISVMIIYGNIYIRQGQEMERSILANTRKDAELAWQRNQVTLSQIRPHFIFNCLGSMEQLCRIDPEMAKDAMHRFAKYLRANMDAMGEKSQISFSRELEHIRNYVWLEQMRFGDELKYEEEISTMEFYIPPLSVQPLVENAIKHGMMGMEEGVLTVRLVVLETENSVVIRVEDNGSGFTEGQNKDDGRSHVGIKNVRESLKQTVNGTLDIQSRDGKGTAAQIVIPKEGRE